MIWKKPHLLGLVGLVTVTLVPLRAMATPPQPPPPATALPPPPPAPASGVTRSTVALWAAGIAVVGAGAATTFGVLALQNKGDYEKHPTYSNTDNGNNDAAYADGAIALAVAAGITSLVLFLTRGPTHDGDPSGTAVSASPFVTPHGGGAGAVLHF